MQLSHRLYYWLKPAVPWRARMMARRIVARHERVAHQHVWPIKSVAARQPPNWPGWPEGKRFAVLLTHDIETGEGLAQVRQLAELEMKFGFRSSFNFIPNGPYAVPADLRDWLTQNGFEVGVHDLQHDGRLFHSERGFSQKAVQINRYLREWNSAGFRAGFMLRNLDWFHQLDIEYDASTFDTDPFELQSDGANTIFPHWISRPDGSLGPRGARGYVELPYTLPQDSTLYLVLRETTSNIWLRKADWITEHGGMVLVNVHPDYIDFTGRRRSRRRYPVARYEELLSHLREKYRSEYWAPLPRELARWYKQACAEKPVSQSSLATSFDRLRRKRAAVLLYSEYPADPRPRRAAEAMIEAGMTVDLLCVAGSADDPRHETHHGVNITRLRFMRSRESKVGYLSKYARFIASSFWFLLRKGIRQKYDVIHVHNMPDVLAFSTILSKLFGAKVILDLHDPMPEVMMTIYGFERGHFAVRLLEKMEKWSIGIADTVITVNVACRRIFSARSCAAEKIHVIMNSPDAEVFRASDAIRAPDANRFVIMYHGSIVERHGLDILVEALARILPRIPQAELRIYGNETPFLRKVLENVRTLNLSHAVKHFGAKPLEEIAAAIRDCEVGVIPNRRSIFTELNTPTRIFEYLSQGKPVIAPRAPGITDYFGANDLVYFELGDVNDLADKLAYVHGRSVEVAGIVARGEAIYRKHLWQYERVRFLSAVAQTLGITHRNESIAPPMSSGAQDHAGALAK